MNKKRDRISSAMMPNASSFTVLVDIVKQNENWNTQEIQKAKCAAQCSIRHVAQHARGELPRGEPPSLALVFADNAFVQNLNQRFRSIDKPTNVLAFPAGEKTLLGDVIIAREVLLQEAEDKNISPEHHAAHLAAHGTLHLLGFDHQNQKDANIMEQLEITILKTLGIDNPYQDEEQNQERENV